MCSNQNFFNFLHSIWYENPFLQCLFKQVSPQLLLRNRSLLRVTWVLERVALHCLLLTWLLLLLVLLINLEHPRVKQWANHQNLPQQVRLLHNACCALDWLRGFFGLFCWELLREMLSRSDLLLSLHDLLLGLLDLLVLLSYRATQPIYLIEQLLLLLVAWLLLLTWDESVRVRWSHHIALLHLDFLLGKFIVQFS